MTKFTKAQMYTAAADFIAKNAPITFIKNVK